jgi:hypothetical protein
MERLPSSKLMPEGAATKALKLLVPRTFGINPFDFFAIEPVQFLGFSKWFVVRNLGLAEMKAGAHINDLAVICELPLKQHLIDPNVRHKAQENFRGVFVSSAKNLCCYYFRPLKPV